MALEGFVDLKDVLMPVVKTECIP